MQSILRYLITFPLIAMPMGAIGLKPALAETAGPVAALHLLAEARAADARCKFFSGPERDELSQYLARAEVAASERMSLSAAQAAMAGGRAAGASSLCDETAEGRARTTLAAARAAVAELDAVELRGSMDDEPETKRPITKPRQPVARKRITLAEPESRRTEDRAIAVTRGGMQRYASEAAAYYADRRCRHLSAGAAQKFWKGIVARHKASLAAHGAPAVAAVLKSSEARAAAMRCGARTALIIEQGFGSVRNR